MLGSSLYIPMSQEQMCSSIALHIVISVNVLCIIKKNKRYHSDMFHSQTRCCHSVWHLCTYLVVYYIKVILFIDLLINTLALAPVHSRFRNADVQGGGIRPPARVSKQGSQTLAKKKPGLLSTSSRDWWCVFWS